MNQKKLETTLSGVVEDCVNSVGVDLNTASAPLLQYVSGINKHLRKILSSIEKKMAFLTVEKIYLRLPNLDQKHLSNVQDFCV